MRGTVYQINSAGSINHEYIGATNDYDIECYFAKTSILHVDPVLDVPDIKNEFEAISTDELRCSLCKRSFGGPIRYKRHVVQCTASSTEEDVKPLLPTNVSTNDSFCVINEDGPDFKVQWYNNQSEFLSENVYTERNVDATAAYTTEDAADVEPFITLESFASAVSEDGSNVTLGTSLHSVDIQDEQFQISGADKMTDDDLLLEFDPKTLKTNTKSFWEAQTVHTFPPHDLPYLSCNNVRKVLTSAEAAALLSSSIQHCSRIPQACRRKAIFLIDSRTLKDARDLQSELNGVFRKCLEVKHRAVTLTEFNGSFKVNILTKTTAAGQRDQIIMHTHRKENGHGLIRHIAWFSKNDQILHDTILLQYVINKDVCGAVDEVAFTVKKHGNSKEDDAFYPVKRSTMTDLTSKVQNIGKRKLSDLYSNMSNSSTQNDYGDVPRNKKQCQNIALQLSSGTRDVESVLAFNEELSPNNIIWYHGDMPSDLWVLGGRFMKTRLVNAAFTQPLSIDPTFNFGAYDVTPFTYCHPLIQSRSKHFHQEWTNAIMLGPTIIHHDKEAQTYERAYRAVNEKTKLGDNTFLLITDGEAALYSAAKGIFQGMHHGRCTNHFNQNCKDFLKDIGIEGGCQAHLLEVVFGPDGLIESQDENDLEKRLPVVCELLVEMESSILTSKARSSKFAEYLVGNKSVLECLIRSVRNLVDKAENPKRLYTNQSESINNILKSKKNALGYSKKDDMPLPLFVRDVWLKVVTEKKKKIEKALAIWTK